MNFFHFHPNTFLRIFIEVEKLKSSNMKNTLFLTSILLFMATLSMGQMTPLDVAKIKAVTSAMISDEGDYVIYTLSVSHDPFKENKPDQTKLYIYDVNQNSSRPLISQGSVSAVALRPHHNSVTFLYRKRRGPLHINI